MSLHGSSCSDAVGTGWLLWTLTVAALHAGDGFVLRPAAHSAVGQFGSSRAGCRRPAIPSPAVQSVTASARMAVEGSHYHIKDCGGGKSTLTVQVAGSTLVFETGRIGRQAHGAVTLTDGETVVYTTACADHNPSEVDFCPMRVDYMERFSAAGLTSGGYNKRDGRPAEREILVSRLMDRPIRPMINQGWTHDTQLLTWVLSYDNKRSPEPLAITSAAAALCLSHIPMSRAVAGVQVGMDANGTYVVNPDKAILEVSRLNLTLAGTADGVLMIEGSCDFLTEDQMVEAITVGHGAVREICLALDAWTAVVGKEKKLDTLRKVPAELTEALTTALCPQMDAALHVMGSGVKASQSTAMVECEKQAMALLAIQDGDKEGRYDPLLVKRAMKKLWSARLKHMILTEGTRCDGRRPDEVRPITIETSVLPRTHGSALFTRGETQALATVTLGDASSQQKADSIEGELTKRFYLQYNFPPSSVGETGRVGAPGRREVGHGNLAERALQPVIPGEMTFPYTLRVESLITESCGSSSMASVCGGCMSLMDAGVPIKRPVAGVAMGLLLDEEGGTSDEAVVLTDILGLEDALGTMDFKVAGDREAITTFQLDIKCEGLTIPLMKRALDQARTGRLHILDKMAEVLAEPRPELSPYVPKFIVMRIDQECIGKVIGAGGKQIRQIIDDFSLTNIDINDDGLVVISSMDPANNEKAQRFIQTLVADDLGPPGKRRMGGGPPVAKAGEAPPDLEIGTTYRNCTVTGVHSYGVFIELLPGVEGLVHVSELSTAKIVRVDANFKIGDNLDAKLIGINERGQKRLSRKAVLQDDQAAASAARAAAAEAAAGVSLEAVLSDTEGSQAAPPPLVNGERLPTSQAQTAEEPVQAQP